MTRQARVVLVFAALGLLAGCAPSPQTPASVSALAGVTYQADKDFRKVWVAQGFDSKGYDTLYIAPTAVDVPKLNADGAENLEWAKGVLHERLAAAIRATNVFPAVVTSEADQAGQQGRPARQHDHRIRKGWRRGALLRGTVRRRPAGHPGARP
jgi:hypothetical protein